MRISFLIGSTLGTGHLAPHLYGFMNMELHVYLILNNSSKLYLKRSII